MKIISLINNGVSATVYKIKIGDKYYALRREKILESEAIEYKKEFKKNNIYENCDKWYLFRLIYFNQFINKINKEHFNILYKYKISKCNFTQKLEEWTKKNMLDRYNQLSKSEYCFDMITDLKEGHIDPEFIKSLSKNQIYSLIIQCLYALNLMHINDFYHRDIKYDNIMWSKTTKQKIKILNYDIPTGGYIYSLVDYQNIISGKFNSTDLKKAILSKDLKYEDNISFLNRCLFGSDKVNEPMYDLVYKIIYNYDNTDIEIINKLKEINLTYKDVIKFYKYAHDNKKIIKYFYKKLQ